jgi:hypothetical protein
MGSGIPERERERDRERERERALLGQKNTVIKRGHQL